MAWNTMYAGKAYSPSTTLKQAINETATRIYLDDVSVLPPAPNIAVIGEVGIGETIKYSAIGLDFIDVSERGVDGVAQTWQIGDKIARNFTNTDYESLRHNIETLNTEKVASTDVQNADVVSEQAATRTNISATDTIKSAFGKLRKWLADLKTVAFTGAYSDLSGVPSVFTPSAHKSTHATGQADAIAPADIGAATSGHNHAGVYAPASHAAVHASNGADPVSPSSIGAAATGHTHVKTNITDFPTSMAPTAHKTSHASGGADALTPGDIGAAAASHSQGAGTIGAGTLAGQVVANATAAAVLANAQVRNMSAGTVDLTAGTSALTTGDIYFMYE